EMVAAPAGGYTLRAEGAARPGRTGARTGEDAGRTRKKAVANAGYAAPAAAGTGQRSAGAAARRGLLRQLGRLELSIAQAESGPTRLAGAGVAAPAGRQRPGRAQHRSPRARPPAAGAPAIADHPAGAKCRPGCLEFRSPLGRTAR